MSIIPASRLSASDLARLGNNLSPIRHAKPPAPVSATRFESIDTAGRSAVVVLPQPHASQPRVDHRRSRIVAVQEEGLWKIVPGDDADIAVTNLALRDTQQFVADAAADPALIERSRRQAERVLGSFFKTVEWAVSVRWRK